jgi:hypothetical protein
LRRYNYVLGSLSPSLGKGRVSLGITLVRIDLGFEAIESGESSVIDLIDIRSISSFTISR